MRYLVLADIHANLQALDAVLDDARPCLWSQVLLLGDLVGYGGQPNDVMARLSGLPIALAVRGNHDRVVAGLDDAEEFTPVARQSADWTRSVLTDAHADILRALPVGPRQVESGIELCHGSPHDEDEYVLESLDALVALKNGHAPVCLFGHTHVPAAYALVAGELKFLSAEAGARVIWQPEWRYLVNVGSVGQPRDKNPRAAYGILDDEARSIEFHRVTYDVETAQAAIRSAGLPEALAKRLLHGR
jgi:diadenosine tetraphosphatase ApaH/serine/threonine PP2A family protein phosphatase